MIAVYAFGLVVAAAVGACIEARRHDCPDPNAALLANLDQSKALAREWHREAVRRGRVARHWRTTAYDHAEVLKALGRVVAEGGTVTGDQVVDPRHPSQRRDEAA